MCIFMIGAFYRKRCINRVHTPRSDSEKSTCGDYFHKDLAA